MKYTSKLALIISVATFLCGTASAAENASPAADNDDSYKLPLFVPKVAQPTGAKVIFDDKASDNDEIYSLPKRAAMKPSLLKPAAGESAAAQKNYNQQYEEYQRQMKLYNEQMAEYKKQLAAQQAAQSAAGPSDNDTNYVLPGQYSDVKKTIKPKPAIAKPKQTAPSVPVQQYTQPVPAQPPAQAAMPKQQYTPPPATTNNSQYYQKYNYSDQDRAPAANTDLPNYYY